MLGLLLQHHPHRTQAYFDRRRAEGKTDRSVSHRVRFLWPGTETVELMTDATDLAAPRYDLEVLRDLLLALPAVPARVTSDVPRQIPGALEPLGRPTVVVSLVLLLAVLLLLLLRLLR